MRAMLLCPGPSLGSADVQCARADIVLGVNRAVHAHPCDAWVFLDARPFLMWRPDYRPVCVTTRESRKRIGRKGGGDELDRHELRIVEDIECNCSGWRLFSSTVALVAAWWWWGVNEIDVYGADMAGDQDYDGYTHEMNRRSDKRWQREKQHWRTAVEWLDQQGVSVSRIAEVS